MHVCSYVCYVRGTIVVLTICAGLFLFVTLLSWLDSCCTIENRIKFKSFKSFYNINPDRWELCSGYVKCRQGSFKYIDFKFNYWDWYKYNHFHREQKKIKKNMESNKKYAKMIELVKLDIANFEAQNQKNIQAAAADIREIVSRM